MAKRSRRAIQLFLVVVGLVAGCAQLKQCAYRGVNRDQWQQPEKVIAALHIRPGEKIADLGPGDIFGEAGMLDDEMRSATVTATSSLKLISMGHFEVKRLKKDAPSVYERIENLVDERSG